MNNKKGFDQLSSAAKKIPKQEIQETKDEKVNWMKVGRLVFKILEPELRKMHPAWIVAPIALLWFEFYGMFKTVELVINIFNK